MSEEKSNYGNKGVFGAAALVLGCAIFLGLNIFMAFSQPFAKVDPESLPAAHTWVWWAAKEYQGLPRAPHVALLGSSILMYPVARADADFLGKDLDYVHHHRSLYMEERLNNQLGAKDLQVFNFALPGSMVSDDFMVVRSLCKASRQPGVVVLALSVRDFIDSGVTCPASTPPFKYLKRYSGIDDVLDLAMPQLWQRLDYYLGRSFYLYGNKLDLQVLLSELTRRTFGPYFAHVFPPCRLSQTEAARGQLSNMRSEIEEGMFIIRANEKYPYQDNSAEYRKRFRNRQEDMFVIQQKFLSLLFKQCAERNIQVVVVNMPLTAGNKLLIPAGMQEKYLAGVRACCDRQGVQFLDADAGGAFTQSDFSDGVHMVSSGGRKLLDMIAHAIANNQKLARSIHSRGANVPNVRVSINEARVN